MISYKNANQEEKIEMLKNAIEWIVKEIGCNRYWINKDASRYSDFDEIIDSYQEKLAKIFGEKFIK